MYVYFPVLYKDTQGIHTEYHTFVYGLNRSPFEPIDSLLELAKKDKNIKDVTINQTTSPVFYISQ